MSVRSRGVVITALLAASACSAGAKVHTAASTSTTTTSTTATVAPTTTAVPTGPAAPLTGLPTSNDQALTLFRPALAVKVDNSLEAMPQSGLNAADIVIEIKVEGISRLMVVFQSHDAGQVGPTRSARYSDPNILALFGKPLFGWSGANDGVTSAVSAAPWIVNVNWDRVGAGEYYRRSGHPAPHNLYTSTTTLYRHAQQGQQPPPAQFTYLSPGATTAGASPAAGVSLTVGDTPSSWVWDAATTSWLRWQYGVRDRDEASGQVSAANVVILATRYGGGSLTPTALTVGSGHAIVLSNGSMVEGTWNRPSISSQYRLTGPDGQPIGLTPGRTWIELTPGATSHVLSPETASGLLSSGR